MKFIVSGDKHLEFVKVPPCRKDNFSYTQGRKLQFLKECMEKHNAQHIDVGDIFDIAYGPKISEAVCNTGWVLSEHPPFYGIAGNHDLRYKSMSYLKDSRIWSLISSGLMTHINGPYEIPNTNIVLHGFNWGQEVSHVDEKYLTGEFVNIAMYHGFVDEKKNTLIEGWDARELIKEFHKDFDFILTGDHHKPFTLQYRNCVLINVGSMMRISAKQKDYKPAFWLIDTETKSFEKIPIPIEKGVVTTEHLDREKAREERMTEMEKIIETRGVEGKGDVIDFAERCESRMTEIVDTINDNVMLFVRKSIGVET